MKQFVNREQELNFLEEQYNSDFSALVVLYGRRRVGKTSLVQEFTKNKPFLYFLASEEAEPLNVRALKEQIAEYTKDALLAEARVDSWDILFQTLTKYIGERKLVLVLDEFQYLGKTNPAFASVFQRIWDTHLQKQNIMVILCGSLIRLVEAQALNCRSPLYGRRTGQIRLSQIDFQHYADFFPGLSYRELVEHYAVTGGTPKYIELFDKKAGLYAEINRLILRKQSLLFEEPVFLLQNEVSEVGSYFSIIKSIAAGNCRLGKICADLQVKETSMPKYLKTLIDLDILEREAPVTESDPAKSKMGRYRVKDNFLSFWFRFVYPEKTRLELGDTSYVLQKIQSNFIDNHVAYVYESVCLGELWRLAEQGRVNISKAGRWWNNKQEIDLVGLDSGGSDIVFGECKYTSKPMDADTFYALLQKKEHVGWKKGSRKETFVLFSISGFTGRLSALAAERPDLILFEHREN